VFPFVNGKELQQSATQLSDYITQARSAGMSDTEIRTTLLSSGWPQDQIDAVLGAQNSAPVQTQHRSPVL
jgi:hypothetical protein